MSELDERELENAYKRVCGENIRKLREEINYSQKELAEVLDCSVGTLGRLERGTQKTQLWRLIRICEFFHVSLDYLFRSPEGSDQPKLPPYLIKLLHNADDVELEILSDYIQLAGRDIERYHSLEQTLLHRQQRKRLPEIEE